VPSRKFIETQNDREFVSTCINWFYSFTNYIENKLEEDYSIASFQQWMANSTEVSPSLQTFTQTYWEKGFKPLLPKLCQRHFQEIYGGDLGANSFTESENAALKKDTMGPRPNQSIDTSHGAINGHEKGRLVRLRTKALQSLSQTACVTVTTELDAFEAILSDQLVDKAVKDLLQQFQAANDYLFFQVSEKMFYVKKFHWESFDSQDPVTRYNRTRIVEVTTHQSGKLVVTCSCKRFMRKGRPCRHLYCVLGRGPVVTDCDVKQLKWFEAYYGREETFTGQSRSMINNRLPGPPVQIPLMIEDARHAKDNKTWFEESLGKIVVRISADADKAEDDDMEAQGFLNMFTNVNDVNHSDDNFGCDLDNVDDEDSPVVRRPYSELMPTYVSMTDLVQTEGDLAFVRKEMNQIYSLLLSRKKKAGPAGNMFSLPEVDQRRKDKRIQPMGSPEKK
jgi:hypothetical protein